MKDRGGCGSVTGKSSSGAAVKWMIWCIPTPVLLLIAWLWIGMAPNLFSLPSDAIILMIGLIITRLIFLFLSHRKVTAKLVLTVIWLVIMAYIGHFGLLLPRMIHHSAKLNAQSRFEDAASERNRGRFSVLTEKQRMTYNVQGDEYGENGKSSGRQQDISCDASGNQPAKDLRRRRGPGKVP